MRPDLESVLRALKRKLRTIKPPIVIDYSAPTTARAAAALGFAATPTGPNTFERREGEGGGSGGVIGELPLGVDANGNKLYYSSESFRREQNQRVDALLGHGRGQTHASSTHSLPVPRPFSSPNSAGKFSQSFRTVGGAPYSHTTGNLGTTNGFTASSDSGMGDDGGTRHSSSNRPRRSASGVSTSSVPPGGSAADHLLEAAQVRMAVPALSQLLQLVEKELSSAASEVHKAKSDLAASEKKAQDLDNIAAMNHELVLQKEAQIRQLEEVRSRHLASATAVSDLQIASLKTQLERTYQELAAARVEEQYRHGAVKVGAETGTETRTGLQDAEDMYTEHKEEYQTIIAEQQQREEEHQRKQQSLETQLAKLQDELRQRTNPPQTTAGTDAAGAAAAGTGVDAPLPADVLELQRRLMRAEIRSKLLTDQINSMPESLAVANVRMCWLVDGMDADQVMSAWMQISFHIGLTHHDCRLAPFIFIVPNHL